jgi:hypothetical protein
MRAPRTEFTVSKGVRQTFVCEADLSVRFSVLAGVLVSEVV